MRRQSEQNRYFRRMSFKPIGIALGAVLMLWNSTRAEVALRIAAPPFSARQLAALAQLPDKTLIERAEIPRIVDSLLAGLRRAGFPLARLDSLHAADTLDNAQIILYLSTGPEFIERGSLVTGLPENNIDSLPFSRRCTNLELLTTIEAVLDSLTDIGFIFAQVIVKPHAVQITADSLLAAIEYVVAPGPYLKLGEIVFPGAVQTRPEFLRRASRLRTGETLRCRSIQQARRRLERLPFITTVNEPEIDLLSPGLGMLRLPLCERGAGQFGGMLASASSGAVLGTAALKLGNLFGTGRQVEFRWTRLDLQRSLMCGAYSEPWIAGQPLQAKLDIEIRQEGDYGSASTAGLTAEWKPADELTVSGRIANEQISQTAFESAQKTFWVEGGLVYDYFDQEWNPGRGWKASITTASGGRRSTATDVQYRLQRETSELMGILPLHNKFLFFGRLSAADISGAGLGLFDLVRVGGMNSLRGYADDKFYVRGAATGSLEFRWRPNRRDGYAGIFVDGGWFYRPDPNYNIGRRHPAAVGITTAFESNAGRLDLAIGTPLDASLHSVRVHLSILGWF